MQTLLNDDPLGTRVTLGDNLVKINANFQECADRLNAVEAVIEDALDGVITDPGGLVERVQALESAIAGINRLPIVQAAVRAIADTALSVSGNLMDNVTDPDGDAVEVVSVSYAGVTRAVGTTFSTTYGAMLVNANGTYLYTPGDAARALNLGQTGTETFGYTVMDTTGGRVSGNFQVTISGTNHAPVARPDSKSVSAGETATGNVLANDLDYEGQSLSLVSFVVAGVTGTHGPGDVVSISGMGTITIAANGAYSFVPLNSSVSGVTPDITYTGTDGTNQYTGVLRVSVAPPPPTYSEMQAFFASYRAQPTIDRPAPNPLPSRPLPDRTFVQNIADYTPWNYTLGLPNQIGRPSNAYDFEVGPGKPYTELEQVPWEYLLPGDRVFVYSRATPYKRTIVISTCGNEDAWIEIIGVRDPDTGAMPILDGDGAICAAGRHYPLFDGAGMVNIGPFAAGVDGTAYGTKVRFVHVTGFEMRNAHPTKMRTARGATSPTPWGEFAQGVYVLGGHNICIQGNNIHNCGQGIFVNSTNHDRFQSHRIHICNNWIYDCSSTGSFSTHGMYLEAISMLVEYNWLGSVIDGSYGDTVKERSSGVVYRYNYIDTSANGVAFRDPSNEDSAQNGILESQAVDSLGELTVKSIYVYGNTFVARRGSTTIVAVGDGANGELREGKLYFYSNVVAVVADGESGYVGVYYDPFRIPIFSIWNNVRSPVTVVARNNLFYTTPKTPGAKQAPFGIFAWGGVADFQSNWINDFVLTGYDTNYASAIAKGAQFTGAGLGGLAESTASPDFVNLPTLDLGLQATSPFFDLEAPLHPDAVARDLVPARRSVLYPFDIVPAPSVITLPSISGSNVVGGTITATGYTFSPLPDSYLFQWYDGDGDPISGATSASLVTTGLAGQFVRVGVRGVSSGGQSAESLSPLFQVISATTPSNTIAPVISGSGQPGYALTVTTGAWTNSPVSYGYQWYKVTGLTRSAISGATTNTVTPALGDEGTLYECDVSATNASAETGVVTAAGVLIVPVQYDPDGTGVFNFHAAANTQIKDLAPGKWLGKVLFGSYPSNEYYFCNGSGKLVGTYVAKNNGGLVWYANGQAEVQQATVTFTIPDPAVITGWFAGPSVNCSAADPANPSNYAVEMNAAAINLLRNGSQVATASHSKVKDDAITLKLMRKSGGVLEVYLNGTMALTYTDASPLAGGYPGLTLNPGSTETFGIDTWTDNP